MPSAVGRSQPSHPNVCVGGGVKGAGGILNVCVCRGGAGGEGPQCVCVCVRACRGGGGVLTELGDVPLLP